MCNATLHLRSSMPSDPTKALQINGPRRRIRDILLSCTYMFTWDAFIYVRSKNAGRQNNEYNNYTRRIHTYMHAYTRTYSCPEHTPRARTLVLKSIPVMIQYCDAASFLAVKIPHLRAIAAAVLGLSPVTMRTTMPAFLHVSMAPGTCMQQHHHYHSMCIFFINLH